MFCIMKSEGYRGWRYMSQKSLSPLGIKDFESAWFSSISRFRRSSQLENSKNQTIDLKI